MYNSRNASYHYVQHILSSPLLFKNIEIKYTEQKFCLSFYMRVKLALRILKTRVLRKIYEPKRDDV
jgi:hypothetical protein